MPEPPNTSAGDAGYGVDAVTVSDSTPTASAGTPLAEADQALSEIVNILGPDDVCRCSGHCHALEVEAREALRIARHALGLPFDELWGGSAGAADTLPD